ncbi:MAG: hypothetical protein MZU95_17545 [Desulfomicrobium escambiense]|nr:hypothetical protein [Desulfomicrobium escambiense]
MAEKLLLVDDEPDMLKLLSMIIRDKTPYAVVTTNNPLEALELVKQGASILSSPTSRCPVSTVLSLLEGIEEIQRRDPRHHRDRLRTCWSPPRRRWARRPSTS